MSTDPFAHLKYKLLNSTVHQYPFAHFHAKNVFPVEFYDSIQRSLPTLDGYSTHGTSYKGRKFAAPIKNGPLGFLLTDEFAKTIITLFLPEFRHRFPTGTFESKMDLRLVLDGENYSIGPHTDAPWKIVSLLFYLPRDLTLQDLGTSIYTPRDPEFRCPGGPHHKFEDFNLIWTAPYLPNSCFGFFKTDRSFHGVQPITRPCRRDVLLWNLYDKNASRK